MTDQWRVLIVNTLTGKIVSDAIPHSTPQYSRRLTDKGSFRLDFLIGDRANSAVDFHEYTRVGKYCWVLLYGDYAVQGGPAWSYRFDDDSRTLSLSGTGIQGIVDKRIVRNPHGHTSITDPSEDLPYEGLSLHSVARLLIAANLAQTDYALPITLPDVIGGDQKGVYHAYDLATVWEELTNLSEQQHGPELDVVPVYDPATTSVSWRVDIGNPQLGDPQSRAVWDYGSTLSRINVDVNGSAAPASRVWVRGSGSERKMLTGFAADPSLHAAGFAPTDYVDTSHSSVTDQAALERYANKALTEFRFPTETWQCSVRLDGRSPGGRPVSPALGQWSLGDTPTFAVHDHPWLPDGDYRKRILGFSHDDESYVRLDIEETAAAVQPPGSNGIVGELRNLRKHVTELQRSLSMTA